MLQSRAAWASTGEGAWPAATDGGGAEKKARIYYQEPQRDKMLAKCAAPQKAGQMQAKLFFGCALKQETDAWTRHYRWVKLETEVGGGALVGLDRGIVQKRRKSAKCTRNGERRINSWQTLVSATLPPLRCLLWYIATV